MMKTISTENMPSTAASYLLSIYRQDGQRDLLGTLEKLGNGEKTAFHNITELLNLLGLDYEAVCRKDASEN